jgi:hypothetical protein
VAGFASVRGRLFAATPRASVCSSASPGLLDEAAEFDTRVPHWFDCARKDPVELLSVDGPQGERIHVRPAKSR